MKKGEKIHLHDGSVVRVRARGRVPKLKNADGMKIRGFVRGALVDCLTGEEHMGDWHENTITTYGHGMVIKNFAGLAGSSVATAWGIGSIAVGAGSTNYSTMSKMDSEYPLASNSTHDAAGGVRATIGQSLSGTWTLTQTYQYASSAITNAATLNCVAQYANTSIGAGSALSFATFEASTKGTSQALNVSYSWLFST